jgi:hypothetical protein
MVCFQPFFIIFLNSKCRKVFTIFFVLFWLSLKLAIVLSKDLKYEFLVLSKNENEVNLDMQIPL